MTIFGVYFVAEGKKNKLWKSFGATEEKSIAIFIDSQSQFLLLFWCNKTHFARLRAKRKKYSCCYFRKKRSDIAARIFGECVEIMQ